MRMPLWDATWRRRTAAGFQARGVSPTFNIIGAMKGITLRQERPSPTEVTCSKDKWSRKGFFALNVQAVCESNHVFMRMSCGTPSSTHDSTALAFSDLRRLLSDR